ncbi:MAG: hypothetical protein LBN06_01065 [Prevotellaceae bacterium]|nr:hypothetical protein [Prevotellaceae bacterium]
MLYNIKKLWYVAGTFIAVAPLLVGCSDERIEPAPVAGAEAYVTLTLNTGDAERMISRSISKEEERTIQNLSVLVYRKNTAGTDDELYYQADVVGDLTIDAKTGNTQALVKLLKSVNGEKYSIVVVANCGKDVGYVNIGKSKTYLQSHLTFSCANKWKAETGSGNYTPIPMWGDLDYAVIDANTAATAQSLQMLRSVARFDVGLDFANKGDLSSETFNGLTGYTLSSVHIYRNRNQGWVIPAPGNYGINAKSGTIEVTKPTPAGNLINLGVAGNTKDRGFEYKVNNDGTHAFVRGIYVSENSVSTTDATTAVVVGITDADGHTGYYRMDLIDGNRASDGVVPVLRNHRYIFNVKSVTGRGQETPGDALNAVNTDLTYNVLIWDENNQNIYLSGRYYFTVDKRIVVLPVYGIDSDEVEEAVTVKYTTNLPKEKLHWQWAWDTQRAATQTDTLAWNNQIDADGTDPDGYVVTNGTISLTAAPGNNTFKTLIDSLCFTAGDIKGHVTVQQSNIDMSYKIDCKNDSVYGSYMVGAIPDSLDNYIEMTLTDIPVEAVGLEWHIWTNEAGGLKFEGRGVITQGGKGSSQLVTLYPTTHTPMIGGLYTFNFYCNSTNSAYSRAGSYSTVDCSVQIPIGFKSKKILFCGDVSTRPNLTSPNPSYNFFFGIPPGATANPNFSINGRMPVNGLQIDVCTYVSDLKAKVEGPNPPDIVFLSYNRDLTSGNGAMREYLERGGVFIYVTQAEAGQPTQSILNSFFEVHDGDDASVKRASVTIAKSYSTMHQYTKIIKPTGIDKDPIYTGIPDIEDNPLSTKAPYFAPLDGSSIDGRNAALSDTAVFLGSGQEPFHGVITPASAAYNKDIIMYTQDTIKTGAGVVGTKGSVFVRWKSRHFVLITDGGVMGGTKNTTLDNVHYPFRINDDFSYRRNPSITGKYFFPSDNSRIFANIMAWAIYQAEFHGINSGGLDNIDDDSDELTRSAKRHKATKGKSTTSSRGSAGRQHSDRTVL